MLLKNGKERGVLEGPIVRVSFLYNSTSSLFCREVTPAQLKDKTRGGTTDVVLGFHFYLSFLDDGRWAPLL